jgi:Ser-tRNA(Ala) deacylase AlaX
MTRKLFWDDPYRATLDTAITSVAGPDVTVAETIFYAFAGGQERDHGTIAERPVVQARKAGTEIVYTLADAHGLAPGDAVRMTIDWERRYALMRLHFAAELVLEVVYQALGSIEKIGAHIAQDKARIDFAWPDNFAPLLPAIADTVRAIVAADRPITSAFSDAAAERRYWELPGFARVACGGTHLRRTGEVGALDLRRRNIGKGKERIEIYLRERPGPN